MSDDWRTPLGWSQAFEAAMAPHLKKGLSAVRVTLVYRKQVKVLTASGERWARIGGRVVHQAESLAELPAVGDWVAARVPENGEALVQAVLPRKSAFVRKVAGRNTAPHVLAANVDTVLVVMGLDDDFNVRRLERYLTLAWESHATPVVVLNKKDLAVALDVQLAEARAVAPDTTVLAVSARGGEGVEPLEPYFASGQTVVVLGSSGVGKSTLVNRVANATVMVTGALSDDGKGKHTTTHRQLFALPGKGSIIDTPGLREVQLWAAEGGLSKTFDDIETLAQACRFTDCSHDAEPGCAVKQALETGTLEASRFASWQELGRELDRLQTPAGPKGRPETKRRERLGHGSRRR